MLYRNPQVLPVQYYILPVPGHWYDYQYTLQYKLPVQITGTCAGRNPSQVWGMWRLEMEMKVNNKPSLDS